jgi:hypothetical protein
MGRIAQPDRVRSRRDAGRTTRCVTAASSSPAVGDRSLEEPTEEWRVHHDNQGSEHRHAPDLPDADLAAPGPAAEQVAPSAAEPDTTTTARPADPSADAPVDRAVHDAALARLGILESRLARAEEENRAFVGSLRHAADLAEQMLQQARAEADELRARATRALAEVRNQIEEHRTAYLEHVQREATGVLEQARAAAHEMVVVARADAREAVHEERRKIADELEMLAAVRARVTEERRALTAFHAQLSGRLRQLVHAMVDFSDDPTMTAGTAFAKTVLTGPQRPSMALGELRPIPRDAEVPAPAPAPAETPAAEPTEGASIEPTLRSFPTADRSLIHAEDEHLDQAFEQFFSSDVEHEPSRRWILED